MDPLTLSALAIALATGISTVAGKLADKGLDAAHGDTYRLRTKLLRADPISG